MREDAKKMDENQDAKHGKTPGAAANNKSCGCIVGICLLLVLFFLEMWPYQVSPLGIRPALESFFERRQNISAQGEYFARLMQSCPKGYEDMCRLYFFSTQLSHQYRHDAVRDPLPLNSEAYAALLANVRADKLPADKTERELVLRMAQDFGTFEFTMVLNSGGHPGNMPSGRIAELESGASEQMAALLRDLAPLMTPEAKPFQHDLAVAILRGALPSPYAYDGQYARELFRNPHEAHRLVSPIAAALASLITYYEEVAPGVSTAAGASSYGLATLYEAYSLVSADPAQQQIWRDKALAEYAACAKASERAADAARAVHSFWLLSQNDTATLALLKDMDAAVSARGRKLNFDKKNPDVQERIPPFWNAPDYDSNNIKLAHLYEWPAPPESQSYPTIMGSILPLFVDVQARIDAAYYMMKLFGGDSDKPEEVRSRLHDMRLAAYRAAMSTVPPDKRWMDMLMRLLAGLDPEYERNSLYYEAEQAVLLGADTRKTRELMRKYCIALSIRGESFRVNGAPRIHGFPSSWEPRQGLTNTLMDLIQRFQCY